MRHETTACFVKQARDFCILTVERVEVIHYKYMNSIGFFDFSIMRYAFYSQQKGISSRVAIREIFITRKF